MSQNSQLYTTLSTFVESPEEEHANPVPDLKEIAEAVKMHADSQLEEFYDLLRNSALLRNDVTLREAQAVFTQLMYQHVMEYKRAQREPSYSDAKRTSLNQLIACSIMVHSLEIYSMRRASESGQRQGYALEGPPRGGPRREDIQHQIDESLQPLVRAINEIASAVNVLAERTRDSEKADEDASRRGKAVVQPNKGYDQAKSSGDTVRTLTQEVASSMGGTSPLQDTPSTTYPPSVHDGYGDADPGHPEVDEDGYPE